MTGKTTSKKRPKRRSTIPATQKAGRQAPTSSAPGEVSDPLELSFGYLFRQANRAFTRALARRLKPHGITLAQWYFLRELWREEGITQRELSRRMDVSEPTTAVALDLMEKAGLIDRQRDPRQRNTASVTLTSKGKDLENHVLYIAHDVNAQVSLYLDPKSIKLARSLIARIIDAMNDDVPGP
jgi:DNA-binding MarR family transcriptional regulator